MAYLNGFTLKEENTRQAYRVKAGDERLRQAVSFDNEDIGDAPSAIVPFSVGAATAPLADYKEDEDTEIRPGSKPQR